MNIMYINHENALGGGTRSLLGIIDRVISNKDVHITVIIPHIGNGLLENELKIRKINYYKLYYNWWMIPQNRNIFIPKIKTQIVNYTAAQNIAKIAFNNQIDIIHSNSSVINMGALVSKITGIPHIWHIREFGEEDHNLKFINRRSKCINFINENSSRVIAISKAVYEKYASEIIHDKLELIYNGVEERDLSEKVNILNKKEFNILLAGAIKENKGQKQAILAIEKLINDFGYKNIFLFLAGSDENGYMDYLEQLVKQKRIESNIKFLGYTEEIDKIRDVMDLELVCSKKEAFGRVTVEAMMSGNPIIGSNTGATIELIINNYNGLLYTENNIIELSEKIKLLVDNPFLRLEMGKNGHDFASKNFTAKNNASKLFNLYEEVIGCNK